MSKASVALFADDEDVLNQVRLASDSNYKVNQHKEPNSQLFLDDDFTSSDVVVYDLDNVDIEKAKLDVLAIKRHAPSKAIILVGDKEVINTFINGDFEFLVFRVFAKPLRAKQMQLLLNSAFGTINDRTTDNSIAETLSVIERIESKNNSPLLKSYRLLAALASIVLLAVLYFMFSSSNIEELNTPSQVNQTNNPIPSNSVLDVDGSISSGNSLLIVGSLSSDPNPIEDAEDEALLAELDALESQAAREAQQSTRSSAPSNRETTRAAPARAAAPRPAPRPVRTAPARAPAPVAPRPAPVAQSRQSAPQAVQAEPVELERTGENNSELASGGNNEPESSEATGNRTALSSISPPVLISKVNPSYPRSAFARGVEGWVDVNISIDENGDVTDVDVIDSEPGRVFVNAVRRAIVNWKYSPAINNATQLPVDSEVQELRISFRLDG